MDKGNAVEFGEPYKLIKQSLEVSDEKKKSFLYSMMQSYGEQQVKELIQLASEVCFILVLVFHYLKHYFYNIFRCYKFFKTFVFKT